MIRIYLAGGWKDKTKKGWQESVIYELERRLEKRGSYGHVDGITAYNPKARKTDSPQVYTWADLQEVGMSDIVFVCLEDSNLAGQGLALEVGYAYAKGIPVVMFDGQPDNHYFDMVRFCSMARSITFDVAIDYLWEFCRVLNSKKQKEKEGD